MNVVPRFLAIIKQLQLLEFFGLNSSLSQPNFPVQHTPPYITIHQPPPPTPSLVATPPTPHSLSARLHVLKKLERPPCPRRPCLPFPLGHPATSLHSPLLGPCFLAARLSSVQPLLRTTFLLRSPPFPHYALTPLPSLLLTPCSLPIAGPFSPGSLVRTPMAPFPHVPLAPALPPPFSLPSLRPHSPLPLPQCHPE